MKQHLTPQAQTVLDHIARTGSITFREAALDHGVQNLTARIAELRAAEFKIWCDRRRHPTTGQLYGRYFLTDAQE